MPLVNAIRKNLYINSKANKNNKFHVAVQCIPDQTYYGLMATLISDIKNKFEIDSKLIVTNSINNAIGFSLLSEVKRSGLLQVVLSTQWVRSFNNIHSSIAYSSFSWLHPLKDFIFIFQSFKVWSAWKKLKPDTNFGKLSINDLECGDLVVDTYLSFKPSPYFNVKDRFVWRLIWQTMRDIFRARLYFNKEKPIAYITTYSTYIVHGIPVRIAIENNIKVYSFGDLGKCGLILTKNHRYHTPDCRKYNETFNLLDKKLQDLLYIEAQNLLDYRISGGIDPATAYMRESAYSQKLCLSPQIKKDLDGSLVIFLHDFYDSPHICEELIFNDFWDWINETIEYLINSNINFFIKPHPNQISLSDKAIIRLKEKYPNLKWLDIQANNKILADAGISCGVTVYGTIAHELAYLGVPSIGAARHPHHTFNFCKTAKTKREYFNLLSNFNKFEITKLEMQRQALAFYSIHNELHNSENRAFSEAFSNYWMISRSSSNTEPDLVIRSLDLLRLEPGYNKLLKSIADNSIPERIS